jgi:hypothetical protein
MLKDTSKKQARIKDTGKTEKKVDPELVAKKLGATQHTHIATYQAGPLVTDFEKELRCLINKHSMENGSNTPDHLLVEYLMGCLDTFNRTVAKRDKWYGTTHELGLKDIKDKSREVCKKIKKDNSIT